MDAVQGAVVTKWFRGRELSMATGISIAFGRLGSILVGWVIPPVYNYVTQSTGQPLPVAIEQNGVIAALSMGLIACAISEVVAFFLQWLDKKADMKDAEMEDDLDEEEEEFKFSDIKNFPWLFWFVALNACFIDGTLLPFY